METFDKVRLLGRLNAVVTDEVRDPVVAKSMITSFQEVLDKHLDTLAVHGVSCNHCGKQVIGVRYMCTVCAEFNLCTRCEEDTEHDHALMKIKNRS